MSQVIKTGFMMKTFRKATSRGDLVHCFLQGHKKMHRKKSSGALTNY